MRNAGGDPRSAPLRGEARRVAERVGAVVAGARADGAADDTAGDEDLFDDLSDDHEPGVLARVGQRLPLRVDPGRRSTVAVAVVVVLAAVLTGLWLLSSRPRSMPVSAAAPTLAGASPLVTESGSSAGSAAPSGATASAAAVATPSPSASPSEVVVDVAGKVLRPGLYRLPPGSRVDDAIKAAGGALPKVDLTSLNLAAPLVDGQQIAVGRPGAAQQPAGPAAGSTAAGSGAAGSSAGGGGPVNLNTASLEQLEELPGIGPALAQRILDYRTEHGSFGSVDQLDDVSGIGTVTFARLKPLVTV